MRYFDKTFFKFTLGFLIIIAISLLIMYAASAYAAGTSKIVILPVDPLTILPDTFSEQMTVQNQDESGPAKTTERINLTFESSSPTGQFFTATGNSLDSYKYLGTDTTNRNFSYKDSTEGTFTITVNGTGATTEEKWTATKQITVSFGAPQNNEQNSSGEVLGDSVNSSAALSPGGGGTTNVSALNSQLEVIAGNDKVVSSGSPVLFQATLKKNTTGIGPELSWSFGDGNIGVGPLVSHTYKYPGEYVVVLGASAGNISSVSRLRIKVIESSLSVVDRGEYLEVSNSSGTEINLFNWKIENRGKGFIFQPNTIILPRSSIKLDKSLLTMRGYDNTMGTCLENSLGEEVFAIAPVKEINLAEASKNLESIKNETLAIRNRIPEIKTGAGVESTRDEMKNEEVVSDTENLIYETPKEENFFKRTWGFITGLFD